MYNDNDFIKVVSESISEDPQILSEFIRPEVDHNLPPTDENEIGSDDLDQLVPTDDEILGDISSEMSGRLGDIGSEPGLGEPGPEISDRLDNTGLDDEIGNSELPIDNKPGMTDSNENLLDTIQDDSSEGSPDGLDVIDYVFGSLIDDEDLEEEPLGDGWEIESDDSDLDTIDDPSADDLGGVDLPLRDTSGMDTQHMPSHPHRAQPLGLGDLGESTTYSLLKDLAELNQPSKTISESSGEMLSNLCDFGDIL